MSKTATSKASAPQTQPPAPQPLPHPITVVVRLRRGNNEYDLVEHTFLVPASSRVLRQGLSRMEADYELKIHTQKFAGLDRLGPSAEWPESGA